MLAADRAKVEWNSAKKHWEVRILVGAEVIKRPISNQSRDANEAALKQAAVAIARDEGYEVGPEHVEVEARVPA
jgi:hypothetical protein